FWQHLIGTRQRSIPVVDGVRYVGMISVDEVAAVDGGEWAAALVADHLRTDLPVAELAWTVSDAVQAMDRASVDRLAVCDGDAFIGVITKDDVIRLDEIFGAARRDTA